MSECEWCDDEEFACRITVKGGGEVVNGVWVSSKREKIDVCKECCPICNGPHDDGDMPLPRSVVP